MRNRELYERPVRDAIKLLTDDDALARSPLAETLLAAAYRKQWPDLFPGQAVRRALRDCWRLWARRTAQKVKGDGALDLETTGYRDLSRFNAMVYTGVRYGLAPWQKPPEADAYDAWVSGGAAVARFLERVFDCGAHPWDQQDVQEAAQVLQKLHRSPAESTKSDWLGYAADELIAVWNEGEEALKEACAQQYYAARERAERRRRRRLKFLRGVLIAEAGLIVALTIYQWVATHAWLDRPDVLQMISEIGRVVERYPQLASIVDAFAWGEVLRRMWPTIAGLVLLALTVHGAENWVETRHTRLLDSLSEWEHNPEAYARRAVQEGRVTLPSELLDSEE
ncbi:MAG: hypothetical protein JXD18_10575 [Anaerolineae bacterium]|nr:hypothetical protein [Anaerolineae bacterium]